MARKHVELSTAGPSAGSFPDPNGLGLGHVSEIQRRRLLLAMAEVACERGASEVSVAQVVQRAGVSRRTFYEIFKDCEDCFLAALEEAVARARDYVRAIGTHEWQWAEAVRHTLEALLRFVEEQPALGRLVVVESLRAGSDALALRADLLAGLIRAVDRGRETVTSGSAANALTAEGVVGGALAVLHGRLASGDTERLVELVNPLTSMIVLPYIGPAAARKELERPLAQPSTRDCDLPVNPLRELDMRLTYRTVRALMAVVANPGGSNRIIGEAAGVYDQGQISKLLARLQRLGLVENACSDPAHRGKNTWTLSKQGVRVASAMESYATSF